MKVKLPDYPWLALWFVCDSCGAETQYEKEDIGRELRTLPKWIEGAWTMNVMCPGCRRTRVLKAKESEGETA